MSSAAGASAPPQSLTAAAPALPGPRESHSKAFASTSAYILGSHRFFSPRNLTHPQNCTDGHCLESKATETQLPAGRGSQQHSSSPTLQPVPRSSPKTPHHGRPVSRDGRRSHHPHPPHLARQKRNGTDQKREKKNLILLFFSPTGVISAVGDAPTPPPASPAR